MKGRLFLFFTGFLQVVFVAINTWQIANQDVIDHRFLHIFAVGFMISFVWSFNVKRVAFGTFVDRMFYAFGAGLGTITGVAISVLFLSPK